MKIVLDTNVLLISIPPKSLYHGIIEAFNKRLYSLVATTPVFLEYEEILSTKANPSVAKNVIAALLEAKNVIPVDIYFQWNCISVDIDDNKFIDAYLNGEADYLVTNDVHFDVVKSIDFPPVNIISADEFLILLKERFQDVK